MALPAFLRSIIDRYRFRFAPYRYFADLRVEANGMMLIPVYRKLYEYALRAPEACAVEVGAGHGASSISLALGMKKRGSIEELISIEKCEGGSRTAYGDKAENRRILEENLEKYGVADKVRVVSEYLGYDDPINDPALKDVERIGILFHDADGEIWRDMELFYNKLVPGGFLIVDDHSEKRDYKPVSEEHPEGGGKYYRAYCFLQHFMNKGYLEWIEAVGDTAFLKKPEGVEEAVEFDRSELEKIQEQLRKDREKHFAYTEKNEGPEE